MPKKETNVESGSVSILFEDSTKQTLSVSKLTPEIQHRLALHGLGQKLVDCYAGGKKVREAGGDEVAWARENVAQVMASLTAGEWTAAGSGGSRISRLVTAIAEVYGETLEKAKEAYDRMSEDDRKLIAKVPAIKAVVAKAEAKAAAKRAESLADVPEQELPEIFEVS